MVALLVQAAQEAAVRVVPAQAGQREERILVAVEAAEAQEDREPQAAQES